VVISSQINSGEDSPNRVRIRQALITGASVVAVACPYCEKMLSDAVKTEGIDDRLEVLSIAEIIERALSI
jgi:heterodisulfide reductase subunit D